MKSNLAVVAVFSTVFEADLAKARLEGEGIHAYIANGNLIVMNWLYSNAIGGVRLEVEHQNLAVAKEILALVGSNEFELESTDSDWGVCPNCGSNRIEFVQSKRGFALTWLLLGFPLLFPNERFTCHNCFHAWKAE
jgi:hypothetical protein